MSKIPTNILLAEDDRSSGQLLHDFLKNQGYSVDWFMNGKDAINNFRPNHHSLIISDIEMPGMDGRDLVDKVLALNPNQVVIMTTVHNEPTEIIPLMRKGIYDYLIKPIQLTDLINRITKAFEYMELTRYKSIIEKERYIRLEEQVQWFKWMEERKNDINQSESKDSFFYNLRTSLTQGAGFGQLVTVLEKLVKSAKEDNGRFYISPTLMELIKENLNSSRKAINSFIEIDKMASDRLTLNQFKVSEIYSSIQNVVNRLNSTYEFTGKFIQLSDSKPVYETKKIKGNLESLTKVWEELFINGFKFSPNRTKVIAIFQLDVDLLKISILNQATRNNKNVEGIPIEYENIIFDPFYRIDHSLNTEFESNELGLGLSLVKNIIAQHSGTIVIQNNRDHAFTDSETPGTLVVSKIEIPILR